MNTLEQIIERFSDEEFLKADGLDKAVVGVVPKTMQLVYDINKVIQILVHDGMDEDDAVEYFEFNIEGAYVGEKTPVFIYISQDERRHFQEAMEKLEAK